MKSVAESSSAGNDAHREGGPSARPQVARMLRSLLRLSGAIAFALLMTPLAPSAAPAPGLAYDEIVRVVVGATPPPPGAFQFDLAALSQAAAAPTPTPGAKRRGLGFGAIAGAVLTGSPGAIGGAVADDAVSNAMDSTLQRSLGGQFAALGASIRGFLQPHLLHYAYENGWERIDDTTMQTATIRKCDIGQVVHLDLAKKTYTVYDPNSEPTAAPAAPTASHGSRATPPTNAPPGTTVADISMTTKALGPMRIDGEPTSGYESTAAFATTQSTGSCRDGSASIQTADYFSSRNRPTVTSCPVRRAPLPESASDLAAPSQSTGGCRPTLTFHQSGPAMPAGKLSLYTLVTMSGANGATPAPAPGNAAGIGFLTERGNLKTLGIADAGLFSVPADFTKMP